ncbi:MAG: hypothetical protein AAEJ52_04130 [Myxococcota bacterium]
MKNGRSTPNRSTCALETTALRSMAALLVVAYAATWLTPCVPVSANFESTRPVESAALAGHASHGGHEVADPSDGHDGHDMASVARDGADRYLVAKCACGCGSRPQAAATTIAPDNALFVQVPVPGRPPLEAERIDIRLTPILTPPSDPIERVPIYFLS